MRMIIIAGLLTVALLGAVLSSVGGERPAWVSAPDETNAPPSREIIGGVKSVAPNLIGSNLGLTRGQLFGNGGLSGLL
jgi:hypothetical protein